MCGTIDNVEDQETDVLELIFEDLEDEINQSIAALESSNVTGVQKLLRRNTLMLTRQRAFNASVDADTSIRQDELLLLSDSVLKYWDLQFEQFKRFREQGKRFVKPVTQATSEFGKGGTSKNDKKNEKMAEIHGKTQHKKKHAPALPASDRETQTAAGEAFNSAALVTK
uniref:Uncharacterized protein n=1 Tax=Panagrolaimus sp. ES5 TaxID=591445 RepID=A0AC34F8I8_9BILA